MTHGFITFLIKRCTFIDVLFASDEFLSSMNYQKEKTCCTQIWDNIELPYNDCAYKDFHFMESVSVGESQK